MENDCISLRGPHTLPPICLNYTKTPQTIPSNECPQLQAIIPLLGVLVSSAVYPQVVIVKLMLVLCISTGGSWGAPPFVNPQSTLNNAGLVARQQHSPCPCYTHVLSRCWRVGTTPVLRTLVDATEHRLIERSVGQTEHWLYRWWCLRIGSQ